MWSLSIWFHLLLGVALLLGFNSYVKFDRGFFSDEGLYALQAKTLVNEHRWIPPDQAHWIDPSGKSNPVIRDAAGSKGTAFYMRHPLFPVVLALFVYAFDNKGLLLPSILGALLSASAVGRFLAPRSKDIQKTGFWLTLCATPLFIYSGLILGHTLAAGLAAWAFVFLVDWKNRRSIRSFIGFCIFATLALTIRTESAVVIAAYVGALFFEALRNRAQRVNNFVLAVTSAVLYVVVQVIERQVQSSVLGQHGSSEQVTRGHGLTQQLKAASKTLIEPTVHTRGLSAALLVAIAVLAIGAILLKDRRFRVFTASIVFATLSYLALFSSKPTFIRGMIATMPVLWFGIWLSRRREKTSTESLALISLLIFIALMAATQYPDGGVVGWGGRFFVVGLPLFAFVATSALCLEWRSIPHKSRVVLAVGSTLMTISVTTFGVQALHYYHQKYAQSVSALSKASRQVEKLSTDSYSGARPVVAINDGLIIPIYWTEFSKYGWVYTGSRSLNFFLTQARAQHLSSFLLVETDVDFINDHSVLVAHGFQVRDHLELDRTAVFVVAQ